MFIPKENTFEIGYAGKITNKLKASLDVYLSLIHI